MGTILSVSPIGHGKRRLTWSDQYNLAVQEPEREYVQPYRVVTDSAIMDQYQVLTGAQSAGLPAQWEAWPDDDKALLGTYSMDETEDPERWVINCTYKLYPDPTTEPSITRVSTGQIQLALEETWPADIDDDGEGIVNSAGDPFDPPETVPEGFLILAVSKNKAAVDESAIVANYLFRTNSTPWRGFPVGQVWLADFRADPDFRNGVAFKATTWTFHARRRGWNSKLLDAGYRCWPGVPFAASVRRTIRGQDGQPVSSPALLDGAGGKLTPGSPAVFLEFVVYGTADFNGLGLG